VEKGEMKQQEWLNNSLFSFWRW